MSIADSELNARISQLRAAAKDKIEQIKAENEALKASRNRKRWKAERDPRDYERQKANQRAEYAAMIAATEGRAVRAYCKVPGNTRAEHYENAKARDAARKRDKRRNASQADKDIVADKMWVRRMRKKNWTDEQITQGLAERAAKRKPQNTKNYVENPLFGSF